MLERNSDKDWKRYGSEDPYYGVVSDDKFHKDNLNPETVREFFRTGEEHADFILSQIRNHMLPAFAPRRVLDFGCGVGRCAIPFGRHSETVLGVDVSEAMIEEGRRNAEALSAANVTFAVSDATLSTVAGPFDLIHSFIVFQHIPPRRGERLVERMIELLSDDGVAALHFMYHTELSPVQAAARWLRKRVAPLHWAANMAHGKPWRYPLMQKNVYDMNRLFFLLRRHGCGETIIRFEGLETMHGVVLFFRKRPDRIPYNEIG
jgi:SAM-dependent methyltransferase